MPEMENVEREKKRQVLGFVQKNLLLSAIDAKEYRRRGEVAGGGEDGGMTEIRHALREIGKHPY